MQTIIYDFLFIITSIFILFKVIGYGIYEIKEMKNKSGGITIITFSCLITILFITMIILN